jgi:hypothetical protein
MNTPRVVAFATLVLVFSLTDMSSAGSIWAKRDKNCRACTAMTWRGGLGMF